VAECKSRHRHHRNDDDHLIDDGAIDEVIRPLKSGKEATGYLVRSGAETRCTKVYRDMAQ
jgi:RIO kinase 1